MLHYSDWLWAFPRALPHTRWSPLSAGAIHCPDTKQLAKLIWQRHRAPVPVTMGDEDPI